MQVRRGLSWYLQWVIGPIVVVAGVIVHRHLGMGFADALYETVQLFILEANTTLGTDPNVGVSAYITLWFVRALAPIITAAALIEILLSIGVFGLVPFWWHGHTIICGAGRLGGEFAQSLVRAGHRVVVIDNDSQNSNFSTLRSLGVKVVIGDASDNNTMALARIGRARYFISVTPSDILNINTATVARMNGPRDLECVSHVYDLELEKTLSKALQNRIYTFNVHVAAARATADKLNLQGGELVVIAGFGRFGQSVLQTLQAGACDQTLFRVVDPALDIEAAQDELNETQKAGVEFIQKDMLACDLWENELKIVAESATRTIILICTDNDTGNLTFGLKLINQKRAEQVYLRLFKPVQLLEQGDLKDSGVVPVVVWKVMTGGLPENPQEFPSALKHDLERALDT